MRELRQVIEQAVLLTVGETVRPSDLNLREPPSLVPPSEAGAAPTLQDMERSLIVQALRRVAGNVTLAAAALGISRDTLRYRMERHGLKRADFA